MKNLRGQQPAIIAIVDVCAGVCSSQTTKERGKYNLGEERIDDARANGQSDVYS